MSRIVLIAGGIGSGKSVVSRVLRCMGYRVYDCDSRARRIMDNDIAIKREIAGRISPLALSGDMSLDRKHLAQVVFGDAAKLSVLNEIVHGAVRHDIAAWSSRHEAESLLFVETAIPKSGGLTGMADAIWMVEAPTEIRVDRVCSRNGIGREAVMRRIEAQKGETDIAGNNVSVIDNDGRHSLLLQIDAALASLNRQSDL